MFQTAGRADSEATLRSHKRAAVQSRSRNKIFIVDYITLEDECTYIYYRIRASAASARVLAAEKSRDGWTARGGCREFSDLVGGK